MMMTLYGMKIITTPLAMVKVPPKRPVTGDMRQMLDDMEGQGVFPVTTEEPGFFMIGGDCVCHPVVAAALKLDSTVVSYD